MTSGDSLDRIVLLGMMGSGKTTIGTALARHLGWELWDSDWQVQARTGEPAAVLAARHGVRALHELEAQLLLEAFEATEPTVFNAAASAVDSSRCRDVFRRCRLIVWLEAPVEVLLQRMRGGVHRRPMTEETILDELAKRLRHLDEIAHLRLDATWPVDRQVDKIVQQLALSPPRGDGRSNSRQ